eukprot:3182617-Rhodomonas_salina.1
MMISHCKRSPGSTSTLSLSAGQSGLVQAEYARLITPLLALKKKQGAFDAGDNIMLKNYLAELDDLFGPDGKAQYAAAGSMLKDLHWKLNVKSDKQNHRDTAAAAGPAGRAAGPGKYVAGDIVHATALAAKLTDDGLKMLNVETAPRDTLVSGVVQKRVPNKMVVLWHYDGRDIETTEVGAHKARDQDEQHPDTVDHKHEAPAESDAVYDNLPDHDDYEDDELNDSLLFGGDGSRLQRDIAHLARALWTMASHVGDIRNLVESANDESSDVELMELARKAVHGYYLVTLKPATEVVHFMLMDLRTGFSAPCARFLVGASTSNEQWQQMVDAVTVAVLAEPGMKDSLCMISADGAHEKMLRLWQSGKDAQTIDEIKASAWSDISAKLGSIKKGRRKDGKIEGAMMNTWRDLMSSTSRDLNDDLIRELGPWIRQCRAAAAGNTSATPVSPKQSNIDSCDELEGLIEDDELLANINSMIHVRREADGDDEAVFASMAEAVRSYCTLQMVNLPQLMNCTKSLLEAERDSMQVKASLWEEQKASALELTGMLARDSARPQGREVFAVMSNLANHDRMRVLLKNPSKASLLEMERILGLSMVRVKASTAARQTAEAMESTGLDPAVICNIMHWTRAVYLPKAGILGHEVHGADVVLVYVQKSKNLLCSIFEQDEKAPVAGLLISRMVLAATATKHAKSDPEVTNAVLAVLEKREDKMDIYALLHLWCDAFLDMLVDDGHDGMAVCLLIFRGVYLMFDQCGLSVTQRNHEGAKFLAMCHCLFAEDWFDANALPGHILWIPQSVVVAMMCNVVSCMHAVARNINTDGMLDIVERYFGTYDLELSFSVLVQQVGYKPTARIALGAMARNFRLMMIRQQTDHPFTVLVSKSSAYDQSQENEGPVLPALWNMFMPVGDLVFDVQVEEKQLPAQHVPAVQQRKDKSKVKTSFTPAQGVEDRSGRTWELERQVLVGQKLPAAPTQSDAMRGGCTEGILGGQEVW